MEIVVLVVVVVGGFFVTRQLIVPAVSPRPDNLGVSAGKLAECPNSPNCVSSQADESDKEHYVAPLPYKNDAASSRTALLNILRDMDGRIIAEDTTYIHAEFRSAMMNYVDDVELYFDDGSDSVQVRSAARLGYSDMGVNRKRVEAIRQAYNGA